MWTVTPPQQSARQTYQLCVGAVRDKALRARLAAIEEDIVAASDDYATAAALAMLQTIPETTNIGGVTAAELSDLYDLRFVPSKSVGRPIYDELVIAARDSRCPLCGHRQVSTLDHHLPKRSFPALTVTPLNLVPSCTDCNKAKLNRAPQNAERQTLHPYFDDVENDEWLHAKVLQTDPAVVIFEVVPPVHWSSELRTRVIGHFELFGLGKLYSAQAAVELQNLKQMLSQLLAGPGEPAVHAQLDAKAKSCQHARTNSWQTALYTALAGSAWFVAGGFE